MKLSMKQKFTLLQLPLFAIGILVALVSLQTERGLKANSESQNLNRLALKSSKYVAEMGGALKGFMLDPTNADEAKRKKEADDNNAKVIEEMKKLTKSEELLSVISEIAELDDKKLNPAEDKVLELVAGGKTTEAQQFFSSTYLPLRQQYDQLSDKLASVTETQSIAANEAFENQVRDGILKIITYLTTGIIFSSVLVFVTLIGVTKALNTVKARLTSVADSFRQASSKVKESANNLADSSTEASAAIQESVSAMTQMTAMLRQTTRNAEATSTLSQDVLQQSQNGERVMDAMSSSMREISESSNRLKEIARVIENISVKTNVINDVVFKTQLLAVNASIEAARAGHHGKGFAVVANEVASLATLSGKASGEIRELLQTSASKVSEIIEGTSKSIANGQSVCTRSTEAFGAIAKSISVIAEKMEEITMASREQDAGVAQTSAALNQMNQAAMTTSSLAQRNATLGQEISEHTSQLDLIDRAMSLVVLGREDATQHTSPTSEFDKLLTTGSIRTTRSPQNMEKPSNSVEMHSTADKLDASTRRNVVAKFRKALDASTSGSKNDASATSRTHSPDEEITQKGA